MVTKSNLQDAYNSFLKDSLSFNLYLSAADLSEKLVNRFSISSEYARKILSRAVKANIIKSSDPYTFGKNQFVYMDNGYILNKESIKIVCKISRPPIYRLLEIMDKNKGVISFYEALKITSSPLEKSSTKVTSLEDILSLLSKLNLIYQASYKNIAFIIYRDEGEKLNEILENVKMENHFAKMVTDSCVMPDILRWLGNSNLINNTNNIYRNKKTPHIGAKHNNLVWDAFAYTKTTGINTTLGAKADTLDKQTLVVLDVILSQEYLEENLDGFYDRIQINRNSVKTNTRKILPIIIYKSCSDYTRNKINKLGFMAFDISSIFGTRIYEILNKTEELNTLLQGDDIEKTVGNILKTIRNAGQEDALKDLKGTLFEFLMYPLLSSIYPASKIIRGKTLTALDSQGRKEYYEYDYIIESGNPEETTFVELKGYNSAATISLGDYEKKSTLKWFFARTLPFAIKQYKNKNPEVNAKALYITSANFWEDGKKYLQSLSTGKLKPSLLNIAYDRDDLLELLNQRGFTNEIKIIETFYTKDNE